MAFDEQQAHFKRTPVTKYIIIRKRLSHCAWSKCTCILKSDQIRIGRSKGLAMTGCEQSAVAAASVTVLAPTISILIVNKLGRPVSE